MHSSEQLAQRLEHWRAQGRDLAFLIGGPEGHASEVLARAQLMAKQVPKQVARLALAGLGCPQYLTASWQSALHCWDRWIPPVPLWQQWD